MKINNIGSINTCFPLSKQASVFLREDPDKTREAKGVHWKQVRKLKENELNEYVLGISITEFFTAFMGMLRIPNSLKTFDPDG